MTSELNLFCENLYLDVRRYWEEKRNVLPRTWNLKFGIFYSPVLYRPAVMIIGANPGYDEDDDTKCPPQENLFYAWPPPPPRKKKYYAIASALRRLFPPDQHETLRESVATNLLFFKTRCLGKDRNKIRREGWEDNGNPRALREIEAFCKCKVEEIVSHIDPSRILVFGIDTWRKLSPDVSRESGCPAVKGTIFHKKALGIVHPTGGIITRLERLEVAQQLQTFLRG